MKNDFAKLSEITELALTQRRMAMAALRKQADALDEQLAKLDNARASRTATRGENDPALRAGADLNWLRWIETRKRAINTERARLTVLIDQEKDKLSQAFGRDSVAQRLARTATKPRG